MKKCIYTCLLGTLMLLSNAFAQITNNLSAFIPSATENKDASKGDKNYMTDFYTGRLTYNAPIKDVNIYGINFPIGLSYSTTGVKVQDVASVTGLAWSFQPGGSIVREVHGIPDDWFYGYCGPNRTGGVNANSIPKEFFEKVADGTWDGEPDKFSFSFLGFSGSFVLDPDGNPLLLSNQLGLKVEYCPFRRANLSGNSYWVLRDQKGTRYYFENSELMQCLVHGAVKNNYQIYKSTWNITKIVLANNQEIKFTYTTGPAISYTNFQSVRRVDNIFSGSSFSCIGNGHTADTTYNENQDISYQPNYLAKISGNGVNIDLGYNLERSDVTNGKALTDISVSYRTNKAYTYKLNYSYFTADDGSQAKRLKLDNISQIGTGNLTQILYKFYYNEVVNLPARNSSKTDYLGYYNNNNQNSNINHFADKSPYLINAKSNILEKVVNSLGGSTHFDFELNSYSLNGQTTITPGLRIKSIYERKSESDLTHFNEISINYNLPNSSNSSGQLFSYYSPNVSTKVGVGCDNATGQMTYYTSETQLKLADLNGTNVGYSNATITKADGSSTRFTFTNYSDYPDLWQPGIFVNSQNSYNYQLNNLTPVNIYSDAPSTSYAFARGKLLKQDLLNSNNQTVRSSIYNYQLSPSGGQITGLSISLYNFNAYQSTGVTSGYNVNGYLYFNQDLELISKTDEDFKDGIQNQVLTETYTYAELARNLPKTIIRHIGSGKETKVSFKYPFDLISGIPSSEPVQGLNLSRMLYLNVIGLPLEVVKSTIRNNQEIITSVNVTKYASLLPQEEYQLETKYPLPISQYTNVSVTQNANQETYQLDSHLQPIKRYDSYNQNNNLTQVQPVYPSGQYQSALYGFDGLYKVAEVNNAKLDDIAYTSFEPNTDGNWVYQGYNIFDLSAVSGQFVYNLSGGVISKANLQSSKSYYVTYWTKSSSAFSVIGTQGAGVLLGTHNGWNLFRHLINGVTSTSITGSGIIDEIRLVPVFTKMISYTYDPLIGITSKTDENNQTEYYSYDEFNRLQFVRDADKNIKQSYCYNLKGEQVNCFNLVGNSAQSGTFYKNDCGPASIGSAVTYVLGANSFYGSTVQSANALAMNAVAQNGQNYANANGICTASTIYARVEYSNYQVETYQNDSENFGRNTTADVRVAFYSDEQCSVPYTLTRPITLNMTENYSGAPAYGNGSSGSNSFTVSVPTGVNAQFLGNKILESVQNYTDPWSGSGYVTDYSYYSYELLTNGNNDYIIRPTI